jgi:hypothetical protein
MMFFLLLLPHNNIYLVQLSKITCFRILLGFASDACVADRSREKAAQCKKRGPGRL